MLDNFYVYETPDFLDLPYIQQLVMHKLETDYVKQGYVRIDATQDPYLSSILDQFRFIGGWLNIYHTGPDGYIPLHIDGHRLAAFNIPIAGCDETSQTIYYEPVGEVEKVYKPDERHYRINGEMKEVYRFALTRPALIRNDVAHDVKRFNATSTRIIASWGVGGTFEECVLKFKEFFQNRG
jgi:hypothetical protein